MNSSLHENEISGIVLDRSIQIHRMLGPGLFESVYEEVLKIELLSAGLFIEQQVAVPIRYGDLELEKAFRADLIVEKKVIVEIKSVELLAPIHQKQLLTYLRLSGLKLGLLINFNVGLMKDGFQRIANRL